MIRALVVTLLLACAGTAGAATVRHSQDLLRFVGKGEANRVTITEYGPDGFVIVDRAGGLRVRGDCFRDTGRRAQCPAGDRIHDTYARLGGGADRLSADLDPGDFRDRANGIDAFGGPGNDRLTARGETVALFRGEGGNDVLTAAPRLRSNHLTILWGGPGDDRLNGSETAIDMSGGPGNDQLYARDGDENDLLGGDGHDLLDLGDGGGNAFGGEGDDRIVGGPNPSLLRGEGGDDHIDAADAGNDLITCGDGIDTVIVSPGDRFGRTGGNDEPHDAASWGCENVTPVA
ncbi:MAG: hypothetical protein QOJ22_513 [Thermoleophilaceae bacterium]|nr:hypothetical protein [Thermoleophilaceae bacterium]